MSRIPQRSAGGAAAAAMISRARLTLFVEGKRFDIPYYEGLIEARPEFSRYGIRYTRVSDIEEGGTRSGGKGRAITLYEKYAREGTLVQSTKSGQNVIAFCLDRDFDVYTNAILDQPEIVYTHTCDVEGELHEFGDISVALRRSLHLSRTEADDLCLRLGDYREDLATRWKHWITLCIAAESLRSRCRMRPSRPSQINKDQFGPVDIAQFESLRSDVINTSIVPDPKLIFARTETLVEELIESKQWGRLLRGKWLASFLVHRIGEIRTLSANDRAELMKTLDVSLVPTVRRSHALDFFDRLLNLMESPSAN